jgi:murein DD-endopeptidase MepM/ murein hydrolase activator NlpD
MNDTLHYNDSEKDKSRRVTISNSSYKTIRQFSYTKPQLRAFIIFSIIFLFIINFAIISYTPLRYFVNGYPSKNTSLQMQLNNMRLDSIYHELQLRNQYINNLKHILNDDSLPKYAPEAPATIDSEQSQQTTPISDETIPKEDKELRAKIEKETQYTIQPPININNQNTRFDLLLLTPIQDGFVSNHFNKLEKHYGIDIVSMPNHPVLAVLKGIIINKSWSLETGYVIHIQHPNGLVSSYKHLATTFVKQGDLIKEGQPIGTVGNTGELSSGPHLHFELWLNSKPLNPEDYINLH